MSLQHKITLISTAETLLLRQKVLKPFLLANECANPGDDLASTYHFGLYHEGILVTVATFVAQSFPDLPSGHPYRLRGMATDNLYRGQGFGQILLRHGIEFLKEKRCDLIWCNARIGAFAFYQKLAFRNHGPMFEIKGIGSHKVMYKQLIPR